MRRALRRAGWALAAAGGIGIAAPALAQSQLVRIVGPGGHVVEQVGEAVAMTEGQARLEESQVELGLLADPMLFSYGLGAHVQGGTMEVRGFVPTEAVREQAVKVAREQTGLPIIDRLKLQPNLATRCSVDKPENIQRAAKELLEAAFPVDGRGMDVRCDARGRVTVTGRSASYEERLLVSRKLRQVNGCSCVANHLELADHESRPAETTGARVVPDALPMPARPAVRKWQPLVPALPVRPVAVPARVGSDPPSLTLPRVYTEPVALPPVRPLPSRPLTAPAPQAIDPPVLRMPRVYQEPVALPPAPAPVVKPLPEAAPKHPLLPPIEVRLPPVKTEARPPVKAPSIDTDRSYGSGTAGAAALNLPPVPHPRPASAVKLPEVVIEPGHAPHHPALPAVLPAPRRPAVMPLPKLPAVEKHDRGASEESYVSEGTITLDDDPPARPAARGVKAPPAARKPAEGTLTLTPPPMPPRRPASSPVSLSVPPKPPAPKPPARPTVRTAVPVAVRLKGRIQGVCGKEYEVKVTTRGRNHLQLEIHGPMAGEDLRVMQRIKPVLASPEFAGIEFDVDVITPAN